MYRHTRQGSQRAQIELLPRRLVRIIRPGAHQRRKVFNFSDGVLGKQQLAKLADVDPPIRGLLEGSVVEIEPVDINVRDDIRLQKCKSRPKAASRPATEATGGICSNLSVSLPFRQGQPGLSSLRAISLSAVGRGSFRGILGR